MIRSNFMNALLGLVIVAGLLVGYNSLTTANDKATPSSKIASYLNLTQAKQEAADAENNVAGTDNANGAATPPTDTNSAMTSPEATPEASPEAMTDSPAADVSSESTAATVAETPPVAPVAKAASTYTVKEGDTYGCIAEAAYGSFENWVNIDEANPNTEGFAEYRLFVGAVLTLPALSADQVRPASTLCK